MTQLFKNNASGRLSGSHNDSVTIINMVDSSVFPVPSGNDFFIVTLYKVTNGDESDFEIIKVTGNDTGTNKLTVVRNQESSGAKSYVDDDYVDLRLTSGTMVEFTNDEDHSMEARNSVWSGRVDSDGLPDLFTYTGSFVINVLAASENLIINFSDGYDSKGRPNNYIAVVSEDDTITVNDNSQSNIYADYDPDTGIVTYGINIIFAPIYSYSEPTPHTGLNWFDINKMKMYEWSGTEWIQKYRVFIGIFSLINGIVSENSSYAFKGIAVVQKEVNTNATTFLHHNLGTYLYSVDFKKVSLTGISDVSEYISSVEIMPIIRISRLSLNYISFISLSLWTTGDSVRLIAKRAF